MNKLASFLTLANFLTLSRIGLTPFLAHAVFTNNLELTLLLFLIGGLTDLLDGLSARLFNQTSKIGELLDPVADKIFFAGFFIALLTSPEPLFIIPNYFLITLIARDLFLITAGFLILKKGLSINLHPRFLGKLSTAWIIGITTFFLIEKYIEPVTKINLSIAPFLWNIATTLLVGAWIDYSIAAYISIKKQKSQSLL